MAHYALQKLHFDPDEFANKSTRTKAFIYGSTLLKIEEEKREHEKLKLKGRRK